MNIETILSVVCSVTAIIVNIYTIWTVRKFWINTARKTVEGVSDKLAEFDDAVRDKLKKL